MLAAKKISPTLSTSKAVGLRGAKSILYRCQPKSSLASTATSHPILSTSTSQRILYPRHGFQVFKPSFATCNTGKKEDSTTDLITKEALNIFALDKGSDNYTYIANHLGAGTFFGTVFGGTIFAQSLIAAEKTVDSGFSPISVRSCFLLDASIASPITYKIQLDRDGRSFSNRSVHAEQNGKKIYSAHVTFQAKAEASIHHQKEMPNVKPPEECKPAWDLARYYLDKADRGELQLSPMARGDLQGKCADKKHSLIELRPVDPDLQFSIYPHKPQPFYYWARARIPLPHNRAIHRALVGYLSDATPANVANRAHVSHGYSPKQIVSLDHNMWIHTDDYNADEWMLYENESPVANNGRALSTGTLWTRDGRAILSVAQDSLSRTSKGPSRL